MQKRRSNFFNKLSLTWQIVLLLTIALLPIGGLAIYETIRSNEQAESLASSALLGFAQQAAELERLEIAEGFGAAKALGRNSVVSRGSAQECGREMARFIAASDRYVFASYTDENGIMACSSVAGAVRDFSESENFQDFAADPRRTVRVVESGNVTNRAVLILSSPVFVDGAWRGFVSLSIPREVIQFLDQGAFGGPGINVSLIDDEGNILARPSSQPDALADDADWLPPDDWSAEVEAVQSPYVFEERDRAGNRRTYAYVPIVEGQIAGLFARSEVRPSAVALLPILQAILLPILIWIICIGLAYISMQRLVVSGIMDIRRSVIAFRRGDRQRAMEPIRGASGELEVLGDSFVEMARTVDASERELSGLVEEKTVLLLEVYHRVKNNLQLMISIMNIQIRNTDDESERTIIRNLRERVMGLALVHQRLYETPNLTSVPADKLVREIVSNLTDTLTTSGTATILSELDAINLHPDQAVPFSLLVTEAMMNALKYSDTDENDGRIDISMSIDPEETVRLDISNSIAPDEPGARSSGRNGMGQPLMRAFVMQLGGQMTTAQEGDTYRVEVTFKRARMDERDNTRIGMPGRDKKERLAS
ncbi:sensor histidine kinase [Roseobacter sp. HKCCA0434]|uniref:sensor histidine kinase n=1 Tax=Roseobacter sp. HKCCA0434 TaxID=3079297 RepID=UPI002905A917|nr:sensor histidine kinase [Roseobacter sp. HKCCA0434]